MKPTALTAVLFLMFLMGCSEKEWKCPEIEDAVLITSEYMGEDLYGTGDYRSFPHAAGDPGSFSAFPDTTKGIITVKYERDDTEIVEVWSLLKLR